MKGEGRRRTSSRTAQDLVSHTTAFITHNAFLQALDHVTFKTKPCADTRDTRTQRSGQVKGHGMRWKVPAAVEEESVDGLAGRIC